MTTRTFPIFRGLQRALGGGAAGLGKHEPALAVTARSIGATEHTTKDDEVEEKTDGLYLPEGYRSDSGEGANGVVLDDPSTWPINSEKARLLRHEFVQEGFRRLYDAAAGQNPIMDAMGAIGNADESEFDDGIHEVEGIGVQLRRTIAGESHSAIAENEGSHSLSINGDEDWLFYAQ